MPKEDEKSKEAASIKVKIDKNGQAHQQLSYEFENQEETPKDNEHTKDEEISKNRDFESENETKTNDGEGTSKYWSQTEENT